MPEVGFDQVQLGGGEDLVVSIDTSLLYSTSYVYLHIDNKINNY